MQPRGGESELEGQEECLRLKEKVRGENQIGAAGLGANPVWGQCWMRRKQGRRAAIVEMGKKK